MLIALAQRVFELDAAVSLVVVFAVVLLLLHRDKKRRSLGSRPMMPSGVKMDGLVQNGHPTAELPAVAERLTSPRGGDSVAYTSPLANDAPMSGGAAMSDEVSEVTIPAPWVPSWLPGGDTPAAVDAPTATQETSATREAWRDSYAALAQLQERGEEPPVPAAAAPGWLPDPGGDPDKLRYWDGVRWTTRVARRVG
jgi:hypothetical protein